MVDESDYFIDKNNHFSTQRDTEIIQSTEFKNRHYNILTGVEDNIKDEHIFDTKRSNDLYHFRYRRQNNIIMDGTPDK